MLVESDSAANTSEEVEIVPGSAAAIEQTEAGPACSGSFQERNHEESKASKPEMPMLGKSRGSQQMVHCRHCSLMKN